MKNMKRENVIWEFQQHNPGTLDNVVLEFFP